ncbi:hypothetical protein N7516_006189 [Penicillium verrucosum]|uniref:uncharacterized protein n=1 Tax=Penicillium verrucosum TaxID=60171 RepID=UPI002544E1CB|nr:uncharacterized protein N7516_006189 [Penicillium verrucosum]KAJ5931700.1 hypothetical protein N7516_006189 [Penicillium verrucosum]
MAELQMQNGNYELGLSGSFLQDLPSSIKRYTYRGESDFFDILKTEPARFEASPHASEFLLFHASKETIDTLLENDYASPVARYIISFDTNEQLFLVRIPSTPHGGVAYAVNTMMMRVTDPMGLSDSLRGCVYVEAREASRGKEANFGWRVRPRRTARGISRSPSVTIEVAYLGNDAKLNSDVRFWLNPDDGKANVCLTLQIGRYQPEIQIEKWENKNNRIHRSQVIWITKRGNQINISHHPLIISFESLVCRPPSCPREEDLKFSQKQLEELAEFIWDLQFW